MMLPLRPNQAQTVELLEREPAVFDMSDPGTGKTRAAIQGFLNRGKKRCLVVAPKSILQAAWGNDIDKWAPGTRYSIAYASNRREAMEANADIYITNHDAVKWLAKELPDRFWNNFDSIVVDESTAFKHHTSQRSKALKKLTKHFEYRENLSGSPNPQSITDIWHQVFLLDDGDRLGPSFWKFRNAVCHEVQNGPRAEHRKWVDKEGIEEIVYDMLRDISIRHKLEGLPENITYDVEFDLPPKLLKQYKQMLDFAAMELADGRVLTAIHASSLNNKLLQIASGAVYHGDGSVEVLDDGRDELVMDLLEPRSHSVVVFQWRHQREQLVRAAEKRGYPYAVIDGSVTSDRARTQAVEDFQDGKLKAIFVHPQSAGHGLTLTKGTTTIFVSPTHNAEHYKQVFHRIYRLGQTERTETIHVVARGTHDVTVYGRLGGKLDSMQLLMDLMEIKEAA